MSPFEYIVVLISIILGLGITQLLSGVGNMVLRWSTVKTYWPHTIIIALIFILHIQDWWATWELQSVKLWYLPKFLFIIFYPVNLYLLTRILFPIRWSTQAVDLKSFYYSNFRKIYLFVILLPAHAILSNYFISGLPLTTQFLQFSLILIVGLFILLNRREEWIHKLLALFLLAICMGIFVVDWNAFLIENP